MSGSLGALRILELAAERLWRAAAETTGKPDEGAPLQGRGDIAPPGDQHTSYPHVGLARLALWRASWGPTKEPLSPERLRALATGLPAHVRLDSAALAPGFLLPPPAGRILLNLILLAAESLPAGGIVVLAGTAEDLFVRIAGPAAAWPAGFGLYAANQDAAEAALSEAGTFQAAVTVLMAHQCGVRLSLLLPPSGQNEPLIVRLGGA